MKKNVNLKKKKKDNIFQDPDDAYQTGSLWLNTVPLFCNIHFSLVAAETQPPSSDHSQHAEGLHRPHPVQHQAHWPLQCQERPRQGRQPRPVRFTSCCAHQCSVVLKQKLWVEAYMWTSELLCSSNKKDNRCLTTPFYYHGSSCSYKSSLRLLAGWKMAMLSEFHGDPALESEVCSCEMLSQKVVKEKMSGFLL